MAKISKIKWKLNILDLFIIAVGLAAVAAAFIFLRADRGSFSLGAGKPVELVYVLQLANVEQATADAIKTGDSVIEVVEKHVIGVVTKVEIKPYEPTVQDYETGNIVLSVKPNYYFVNLTMTVSAKDTGRDVNVDGFALRGGSAISVSGPGWAGAGMILDIER